MRTYVCKYAVEKVAQSKEKVYGKKKMGRDNESNMDQFDGQEDKLGLKMI